jgi:hypothetical protein
MLLCERIWRSTGFEIMPLFPDLIDRTNGILASLAIIDKKKMTRNILLL